MKDKFIKKYMRMAKLVAEDQNPCYSRKVGTVLVDPILNKVLATGYNGPPRETPHCDSPEYLAKIVWPQLTAQERTTAIGQNAVDDLSDDLQKDAFLKKYSDCKMCPRRILGCRSGTRLELCSCEHGERNAISQSTTSLFGAHAFCWCPISCWECAKMMINAGITHSYFVTSDLPNKEDYSFGSRWLFAQAKMNVVEHPAEYYLND